MGKRFVSILIMAVLAAAGVAAVVLRPGFQPARKESTRTSSSVTATPAPEQAVPSPKQPGRVAKPAGKDASSRSKDKASDKDQTTKGKNAAQKSVPGGRDLPRNPASNGDQSRRSGRAQTVQLLGMVMRIMQIERSGEHVLTADQARRVLAILKPLRTKDKLTDGEAGKALDSLKNALTADQLKATADMGPRFSSGRRPDQGGTSPTGMPRPDRPRPNGPTGPPRAENGQRPAGPRMLDFNPFASKAPAGNERANMMVKMMDEFFAGLEKKAKAR